MFTLRARKTPKTSGRRPFDEGTVRPVIASNEVPCLRMRSVGLHSTSGMQKEGKNGLGAASGFIVQHNSLKGIIVVARGLACSCKKCVNIHLVSLPEYVTEILT